MTTDATNPYPHADADADPTVGVDDYAADRRRLFDTDSSTLTLMQRITWVKLLKRPYLSARRQPRRVGNTA
ncbi:MAG: hypothetical protein EOP24_36415 [Hyphomicrobiales bacterium]|nr:MAG: hypothetical protein EOP24_36415 [Hyphomicrobiales bacterium]